VEAALEAGDGSEINHNKVVRRLRVPALSMLPPPPPVNEFKTRKRKKRRRRPWKLCTFSMVLHVWSTRRTYNTVI
jgi:hypothetical protein